MPSYAVFCATAPGPLNVTVVPFASRELYVTVCAGGVGAAVRGGAVRPGVCPGALVGSTVGASVVAALASGEVPGLVCTTAVAAGSVTSFGFMTACAAKAPA